MKTLSLAMLLVGTIIGAGFASGRELLSFFGNNISLAVAPLCGLGFFIFSVLFMSIGRLIKAKDVGEVNSALFGKARFLADIFLLFNSLTVLGGMLAGMDSLFSQILPIAPAYSILSGLLCAVIVGKGLKGLLGGNMIIVPFIIISTVIICCLSSAGATFSGTNEVGFAAAAIYVGMNMMLAATVLTTVKDFNKKQIFIGSGIAAIVITALMFCIILALNASGCDGEMPVLEMAAQKSRALFYLAVFVVAISIFTTMMTAMNGLTDWLDALICDRKYSISIVLLSGLIISNFGFERVISVLYPVIGIFGLVYIGICFVYVLRSRKKSANTKLINKPTVKRRNTA